MTGCGGRDDHLAVRSRGCRESQVAGTGAPQIPAPLEIEADDLLALATHIRHTVPASHDPGVQPPHGADSQNGDAPSRCGDDLLEGRVAKLQQLPGSLNAEDLQGAKAGRVGPGLSLENGSGRQWGESELGQPVLDLRAKCRSDVCLDPRDLDGEEPPRAVGSVTELVALQAG